MIFVLLVFLYKPDNVDKIETVLDNYQRPKKVDTNDIKSVFSVKLPYFDFNRTTTQDTTRYSFNPITSKPISSNVSTISTGKKKLLWFVFENRIPYPRQ